MKSKRCSKCGVVKPLDGYNRDKHRVDGRRSECRECSNKANRAWQDANRERVREANRVWREMNRERSRENSRAWREANPERKREINRAWNEANKGRVRETSRAWKQANPERSRELSRAWERANADKRSAIVHRRRARKSSAVPQRWTVDHTLGDPLACWWCGRGLLGTAVHTDHVMPISLGGPAETANEVMSCEACNIRKKAKHPLVWIAELVS